MRLLLYLAAIGLSYLIAWPAAFVLINGPAFRLFLPYLKAFWTANAGERPLFTGLLSVAIAVPLSALFIWLLGRGQRASTQGGRQ